MLSSPLTCINTYGHTSIHQKKMPKWNPKTWKRKYKPKVHRYSIFYNDYNAILRHVRKVKNKQYPS